MGSKKHKKHHKSDKRDVSFDDRAEKPLKLVLKVAGTSSSIQTPPTAQVSSSTSTNPIPELAKPTPHASDHKSSGDKSSSHSEKHKKSKKKKKKKSSEKDKDRHEKKRKHHHHHHHHREHSRDRKEKRKREQQDHSHSIVESQEDNVALQKAVMLEAQAAIPPEKPMRDPRTCTLKKKSAKSPLQILLYYMLKKLQLKDPQEYFAWPVTDSIAPGYSSIIRRPIDFSTIKKKIDEREYKSILDFRSDIKLMCDNCMTYNRSDTVYYKAARKLWHAAQKQMSKEQLISMKRNFPYLSDLSEQELGFDMSLELEESLPGTEIATELNSSLQPEARKTKVLPSWNTAELDDDDDSDEMSPEDILAEAKKAAKAAAEKLTLKRPNSKFGFLRQHENGTTTLSILHPKSGDPEIKVNLETLAGKLSQGTGSIVGFKEDSKNIIKPVTYTSYGAYSSFAPYYDSTFSNLTKEQSNMVMTTYGDDVGVQYAESIMNFARDSDYVMTMVDNMLDVLTGGEHSKTIKLIDEQRKAKEDQENLKNKTNIVATPSMPPPLAPPPTVTKIVPPPATIRTDTLIPLGNIDAELSIIENSDIETSGKRKIDKVSPNKLDLLQKHKKLLTQRKAIQQKLDNATQLLQDLRKVQNERLSSAPPSHLSLVQGPSPAETELADKLSKKIADIALQLPPESVSSVGGLRKAMGITCHPKTTTKSIVPTNLKRTIVLKEPSTSRLVTTFQKNPNVHVGTKVVTLVTGDVDPDLQKFLETGPMLRVCDSPTGKK